MIEWYFDYSNEIKDTINVQYEGLYNPDSSFAIEYDNSALVNLAVYNTNLFLSLKGYDVAKYKNTPLFATKHVVKGTREAKSVTLVPFKNHGLKYNDDVTMAHKRNLNSDYKNTDLSLYRDNSERVVAVWNGIFLDNEKQAFIDKYFSVSAKDKTVSKENFEYKGVTSSSFPRHIRVWDNLFAHGLVGELNINDSTFLAFPVNIIGTIADALYLGRYKDKLYYQDIKELYKQNGTIMPLNEMDGVYKFGPDGKSHDYQNVYKHTNKGKVLDDYDSISPPNANTNIGDDSENIEKQKNLRYDRNFIDTKANINRIISKGEYFNIIKSSEYNELLIAKDVETDKLISTNMDVNSDVAIGAIVQSINESKAIPLIEKLYWYNEINVIDDTHLHKGYGDADTFFKYLMSDKNVINAAENIYFTPQEFLGKGSYGALDNKLEAAFRDKQEIPSGDNLVAARTRDYSLNYITPLAATKDLNYLRVDTLPEIITLNYIDLDVYGDVTLTQNEVSINEEVDLPCSFEKVKKDTDILNGKTAIRDDYKLHLLDTGNLLWRDLWTVMVQDDSAQFDKVSQSLTPRNEIVFGEDRGYSITPIDDTVQVMYDGRETNIFNNAITLGSTYFPVAEHEAEVSFGRTIADTQIGDKIVPLTITSGDIYVNQEASIKFDIVNQLMIKDHVVPLYREHSTVRLTEGATSIDNTSFDIGLDEDGAFFDKISGNADIGNVLISFDKDSKHLGTVDDSTMLVHYNRNLFTVNSSKFLLKNSHDSRYDKDLYGLIRTSYDYSSLGGNEQGSFLSKSEHDTGINIGAINLYRGSYDASDQLDDRVAFRESYNLSLNDIDGVAAYKKLKNVDVQITSLSALKDLKDTNIDLGNKLLYRTSYNAFESDTLESVLKGSSDVRIDIGNESFYKLTRSTDVFEEIFADKSNKQNILKDISYSENIVFLLKGNKDVSEDEPGIDIYKVPYGLSWNLEEGNKIFVSKRGVPVSFGDTSKMLQNRANLLSIANTLVQAGDNGRPIEVNDIMISIDGSYRDVRVDTQEYVSGLGSIVKDTLCNNSYVDVQSTVKSVFHEDTSVGYEATVKETSINEYYVTTSSVIKNIGLYETYIAGDIYKDAGIYETNKSLISPVKKVFMPSNMVDFNINLRVNLFDEFKPISEIVKTANAPETDGMLFSPDKIDIFSDPNKEYYFLTKELADAKIPHHEVLFSDKIARDIIINKGKWVWSTGEPHFDLTAGGIDELLLPQTDFDYTAFKADLLDPVTHKPLKPVQSIDDRTFIAARPVNHPLPEFKDIAKEYIDINVSLLRHLIEKFYSIWQENIFKFGAMDMRDSVAKMLEYMDIYITYHIPDDLQKQARRVLRLFRWYGEASIAKHAQYKIHIVYEPLKSNLHRGDCDIPYTASNMYIHPVNYTFSNSDIREDAWVEFEVENPVDTTIEFMVSMTSGSLQVYINDTLFGDLTVPYIKPKYDLAAARNGQKNRIKLFFKNDNNGIINIANVVISDMVYSDMVTEYAPSVGTGNKVLDDLIKRLAIYEDTWENNQVTIQQTINGNLAITDLVDRLNNYFFLHHEKKKKGKRLTIKK